MHYAFQSRFFLLYGASIHETCIAIFDLFKPICRIYLWSCKNDISFDIFFFFTCIFKHFLLSLSFSLNSFAVVATIFLFVWPRTNGNYELLTIIIIVVNDDLKTTLLRLREHKMCFLKMSKELHTTTTQPLLLLLEKKKNSDWWEHIGFFW